MDAAQALGELRELSSQITAAIILDAGGTVLASSPDDPSTAAALASTTQELVAAAADLSGQGAEVTRVEVELAEGGVFVVREGEHTVVATTGPDPTAGLVVYDLRTCVQSIAQPEPKKRRSPRKPKAESS